MSASPGVIAFVRPGIVALQAVDRNRDRTGDLDQTVLPRELTGIANAYAPILGDHAGEYGLSVLAPHSVAGNDARL